MGHEGGPISLTTTSQEGEDNSLIDAKKQLSVLINAGQKL